MKSEYESGGYILPDILVGSLAKSLSISDSQISSLIVLNIVVRIRHISDIISSR